MGKNQAYKQQQRAKAASRSSTGPAGEGEEGRSVDGMVDGTFHSPEWHAARLASLQTTHTVTWEEWKAQRKEEIRKQQEEDGYEERRMKEYREQLDRERSAKLARGRNHADKRDKLKKRKDKKKGKGKDKDKDKDKSKTSRKKKSKSSSSNSSESDESPSDSEDKKSKKKRRKTKGSDGDLSSASEEEGPVRLSSFLGGDGDLSDENGKGRPAGKLDPMKSILEEAKRRAEIGAHMVAEVKRADELSGGRKRRGSSERDWR